MYKEIKVSHFLVKAGNRNMKKGSLSSVMPLPIRAIVSCIGCWEISWWL